MKKYYILIAFFVFICSIFFLYENDYFNVGKGNNHGNDDHGYSFEKLEEDRSNVKSNEKAEHILNKKENNYTAKKSYSYKEKLEKEVFLYNEIKEKNKSNDIKVIINTFKAKGITLPDNLIAALEKDKFTDEEIKDSIQQLAKLFPEGELEFRNKLESSFLTFDEALEEYKKRAEITGLNYDQELLSRGSEIYGSATFEKVKELLNKGARLSDESFFKMAAWQNVDLMRALQKDGYTFNAKYTHPVTQQNMLGAFVAQFPRKFDDESAQAGLKDLHYLLDAGVEITPSNEVRDALDYTFEKMKPENVKYKILIAKELLSLGAEFSQSHMDLVNQYKQKYPESYESEVKNNIQGYMGN